MATVYLDCILCTVDVHVCVLNKVKMTEIGTTWIGLG
jgi:hypothetical protein